MSQLTIVANITAKPDAIERVRSALDKVIEITRQEEGCLQYDLHQDNENPAHFMFFENWESREHWQEHMNAPHLQEYRTATEGDIQDFSLFEMTKVG